MTHFKHVDHLDILIPRMSEAYNTCMAVCTMFRKIYNCKKNVLLEIIKIISS